MVNEDSANKTVTIFATLHNRVFRVFQDQNMETLNFFIDFNLLKTLVLIEESDVFDSVAFSESPLKKSKRTEEDERC